MSSYKDILLKNTQSNTTSSVNSTKKIEPNKLTNSTESTKPISSTTLNINNKKSKPIYHTICDWCSNNGIDPTCGTCENYKKFEYVCRKCYFEYDDSYGECECY